MANRIYAYMHCGQCLKELPQGVSPKEFQRVQVGYTKEGIQVWCLRHECNVLDLAFTAARNLGDDYGEEPEHECGPWCAGFHDQT